MRTNNNPTLSLFRWSQKLAQAQRAIYSTDIYFAITLFQTQWFNSTEPGPGGSCKTSRSGLTISGIKTIYYVIFEITFLPVTSLLIITTFAKMKGHNSPCLSWPLFLTILHVLLKRLLDSPVPLQIQKSPVGLAAFPLCLIKDPMQASNWAEPLLCLCLEHYNKEESHYSQRVQFNIGCFPMQELEQLIGFPILNFLC